MSPADGEVEVAVSGEQSIREHCYTTKHFLGRGVFLREKSSLHPRNSRPLDCEQQKGEVSAFLGSESLALSTVPGTGQLIGKSLI